MQYSYTLRILSFPAIIALLVNFNFLLICQFVWSLWIALVFKGWKVNLGLFDKIKVFLTGAVKLTNSNRGSESLYYYFRLNMIASKILGLCVILVVASAAKASFWSQGALSNFFLVSLFQLLCVADTEHFNKVSFMMYANLNFFTPLTPVTRICTMPFVLR